MMPIMAVCFVSVLDWRQLFALLGTGSDRADWGIRIESRPLPAGYTLSMLMANLRSSGCLTGRSVSGRSVRRASLIQTSADEGGGG
jgi:hypothetical protein